tara:strand:+ start:446 stop:694 length:249 start_codon:yes stop_codon:yes gene_type:complete
MTDTEEMIAKIRKWILIKEENSPNDYYNQGWEYIELYSDYQIEEMLKERSITSWWEAIKFFKIMAKYCKERADRIDASTPYC